jgi:hypothetical protein
MWVLPISPPGPWFVAMKVNWLVVRKVTMVVRVCKVILCLLGFAILLVIPILMLQWGDGSRYISIVGISVLVFGDDYGSRSEV